MQLASLLGLSIVLSLVSFVSGHACPWHPSMFGFNYTRAMNKPQDPLQRRKFGGVNGWWFHGHIDYPPHPQDVLKFPAGGETFVEITCDKAASSYYKIGGTGTDIRRGNNVCPGASTLEYHTKGINDVKGCAFAIAYTPATQAKSIKPEDFVVFSVNHTCVWERFTKFQVPANMPPCPKGGCTCAWFWIHSADAGAEQIYMNAYQCDITGARSTAPLAKPHVPRRCGADNDRYLEKPFAPKNCTYGAKQPLYWLQQERNNVFENSHGAPFYNDLYGFKDGAQNDIFVNSHLPAMDWHGAPITGNLLPVPGVFPNAIHNNAQPEPTPSSKPSGNSPAPSPSPSPSPSPTPKNVPPKNIANTPSGTSSTPPATHSPSSSDHNPPKGGCHHKHKHQKNKRPTREILSHHHHHVRKSFRRHH